MNGHDVHLLHVLWPHIGNRLAPVEHGRELQQQTVGLLQQLRQQWQHIGGAVGDAVGAVAVVVAAGWVEEDERHMLLQLMQTVGGIAAHRGDGLAQRGKVRLGNGAQLRLPLHIDGSAEEVAEEGGVNAEASRQVEECAIRR